MYYTYIVYSPRHDRLLIGVTTHMERRKKILCHMLEDCKWVYYEAFDSSREAILRENEWLTWSKTMIREMVDQNNPMWVDLISPGHNKDNT